MFPTGHPFFICYDNAVRVLKSVSLDFFMLYLQHI